MLRSLRRLQSPATAATRRNARDLIGGGWWSMLPPERTNTAGLRVRAHAMKRYLNWSFMVPGAWVALLSACGPQLKLPSDPLQLTLPQRSTETIPGSDGRIQITVTDITEGQVLLSIETRDGKPILLRRSVREDDVISFEVGRKQYYLHVAELRNLLTGRDFVVLEISSQPPARNSAVGSAIDAIVIKVELDRHADAKAAQREGAPLESSPPTR